ncbi:BatA protein [Cloacibacterium rupense]|uniref:BatA protein n=1 Tax=Cloacibacterium rupense TaxID=517423 RepID=A0ABQ2NMV9_9FLAO|nr:VWA domain-containing protein [Cloacibacterium rupense]GGP06194.1 BatA protein [Cloacibacterium rupense]
MNFEFHNPYFLALFLLFIPLVIRDFVKKKKQGINVPTTKNMMVAGNFSLVQKFLTISKYIILSGFILAISRPRTFTIIEDRDEKKGVDIFLAVDISPSMLAKDLEPDRITALKGIAKDFVKKRTSDRIGLVEYWGEAITKVPLTSDHQVILDEINEINPSLDLSGTAIGEGLSVAVNHLKNSKSKNKIIILMTDGVNTVPNAMPPQIAGELAKGYGIKVYNIGIGTNGYALFPVIDVFGISFEEQKVEIDEATLSEIANITGGKYYRATTNESLKNIYNEIDSLEKSKIKSDKIYNYDEYFRVFLWISLLFLLIDAVMRWRFFRIFN